MTMTATAEAAQQIQSQPDEAELERASALAVARLLRAGGYGRDRMLGQPYDPDSDDGGQDAGRTLARPGDGVLMARLRELREAGMINNVRF